VFYPAKMKRVHIITHSDYILHLTGELHESGLMEIDPVEIGGLERRLPEHSVIDSNLVRVRTVLENIRYEEPVSIKEVILHPKPPEVFEVPEYSEESINEIAESVLPGIESEMERLLNKKTGINEKRGALETKKDEILPLTGMKFDLSLVGKGEYASIIAGTTGDIDALKEALASDSGLIEIYHTGAKGNYSAVIVAHNSEMDRVEKARRQRLFDALDVEGLSGTPAEAIEEIETQFLALKGELKDVEKEMHALYKEHRKELLILKEELEILSERGRVFEKYGVTEHTTTLTGWVEEKNTEALRALCEESTGGNVALEFTEPEGDEAPTKLSNPHWARPFEALVTTYGAPKYTELDPTLFVGPLFIVLFGLMVGDAGYGLIILFLSIFAYFHIAKYSEEIKEYAYYGILMGLSTAILGFLMGGLFYDLIQRLITKNEGAALYPTVNVLGVKFPFDPMNDPVSMFLLSIYIGLVVLNVGIIFSAINNIRHKNYHDLVTDNLSWAFIEPTGILLIAGKMLGAIYLDPAVTLVSTVGLLIGVALRFPVSGGLVLFDLTGFVGNALSFARILALALATAGLALTINIFAQIFVGINILHLGPLFILLAIVFLIVGHIANTGLQSLGAAIHSIRLNYVELFSMFFSGGGKSFTPFHEERTYTQRVTNSKEEIA